ncbi:MAG: fibronectin type III domain-containing protein [Butyricicoccus sp.]
MKRNIIGALLAGAVVCMMCAACAMEMSVPEREDGAPVIKEVQPAEPLPEEVLQQAENDWNGVKTDRKKDGILLEFYRPDSASAFVSETVCRQYADGKKWREISSMTFDPPQTATGVASEPEESSAYGPEQRRDTDCKNGQEYRYKVVYCCEDGTYLASKVAKGMWLEPPEWMECESTESGAITMQWTENPKADGYQVEYTYTVKRKGGGKVVYGWKEKTDRTSMTLTKQIKPGRTYRVCVRAYKTVDGMTYSSTRSEKRKVTMQQDNRGVLA